MAVEVRAVIAGALLVMAVALTGCSQPASTPAPTPAPTALPDPVVLPIKADSLGGAVVVSADSSRVFVSRSSTSSTDSGLDVVDARTSTVLGTLSVDSGYQLAVSPDGKWLFVDGLDGIMPIDLATHLVQDVLGDDEVGGSSQLGVTPDSRRLLITSTRPGTPAVLRIVDLADRTETGSVMLPGELNTETAIEFSPDGRHAYVLGGEPVSTELLDVDLESRTVTPIQLEEQGRAMQLSPDGRQLYVQGWQSTFVLDLGTRTVVNRLPAGEVLGQLLISPNGRYLFSIEPQRGEVRVIDTANGTVVTTGRLSVPGQGGYVDANSVALAPDGRRLYLLTEAGLAVIDTSAFA